MTEFNAKELANPGVRNLSPYQAGKPIEEVQRELGLDRVIKLASNENPLGPSPKALAAIRGVLHNIHLYPDAGGYKLRQALADLLKAEGYVLDSRRAEDAGKATTAG